MAKILIWKGKHGDEHFDVSTEAKKAAALKQLFETLNDPSGSGWNFYAGLRDGSDAPEESTPCRACKGTGKVEDPYYRQHKRAYDAQKSNYDKALKGDTKAIEQLLLLRSDYEYERVEFTETR